MKFDARVLFEPRDIWVGVFWRRSDHNYFLGGLDVFVCLLPCLPIRLRFWWHRR